MINIFLLSLKNLRLTIRKVEICWKDFSDIIISFQEEENNIFISRQDFIFANTATMAEQERLL